MNTPLIILRTRGETATGVRLMASSGAGEIQAPQHRLATCEFARLIAAHPSACMAWYDEAIEAQLTPVESWPALLKNRLEVLHLACVQRCDRMVASLGYVDFSSPFLLAGPTDRRFGTWLISPLAGIGHCELFLAAGFDGRLKPFALALFDVGYRGLQQGLIPYSEPALLREPGRNVDNLAAPAVLSEADTCRLIRRMLGRKWVLFWLAAKLLYEHRLPVIAASVGLLARRPPEANARRMRDLHPNFPPRVAGSEPSASISVIIPTLGRPEHVRNLLEDLAGQVVTPTEVIIVEQDPRPEGNTALTDLAAGTWSFIIRHHFVNWVGACKARNLAMAQASGEWLLFLDDDVRLRPDFTAVLLGTTGASSCDAAAAAVYLPGQSAEDFTGQCTRVWHGFPSGACLVRRAPAMATGGFDERIEGGFGEDTDFGLALRQAGATVLYAPSSPVLHLKTSAGGFRYTFPHPWLSAPIQPRPSPTILYTQRKHLTPSMLNGYQLFYTLKRLTTARWRDWLPTLQHMRAEWQASLKWAQLLQARGART